MDRRERANDDELMIRLALDGRQAKMWTALPGIIDAFDPVAMTCRVQPAIQGKVRAPDGTVTDVTLPLLLDCPVVFTGGGGWTLTFPVTQGDECLVVFGSRCIDAWWQSGGVQPQAELRMHDLSDGFALVGVRSQPRVIENVSTTSTQLRSDDGTMSVDMNHATGVITHTAPTKVVFATPLVEFAGIFSVLNTSGVTTSATINGTLHATVDVISDTISGKTHHHSDPQGGTTGTPV